MKNYDIGTTLKEKSECDIIRIQGNNEEMKLTYPQYQGKYWDKNKGVEIFNVEIS